MSIYFDFKTISELTENNFYRNSKELTSDELTQYNGINEKPSRLAMEGIVYDVSNEANWDEGTHYGLNASQNLTEKFNSSDGMMQIVNNASKVGILADSNFIEDMNRQIRQNDTSNFRPDDWIRYIEPIVSHSLRETNQGTGQQANITRQSYQKAILLGVLVGLGRTPQDAINQVQQWQNSGMSTLLGGPSTGGTTGIGTTTGGTTGTGTTTGGTTGTGTTTGGTTGTGTTTGGTTGTGTTTGGTTGTGTTTGGTTGIGTTTGSTGTTSNTRGEQIVRNRLFFD